MKLSENGPLAPQAIARELKTTSKEVAYAAGLGEDVLQDGSNIQSENIQRQLPHMVAIISRTEPRFGSASEAYAWYRSEPLPGFSGQTAMGLFLDGRGDEVLDYLDAVDAGIHA